MSHSQFHSTKLFILRHAWLNLLSEHITAGRINQVSDENFGREHIHPPNSSQSKQKLFQYVQTHIPTRAEPTTQH